MKKIIGIILVLAMCLSLLPVAALAAPSDYKALFQMMGDNRYSDGNGVYCCFTNMMGENYPGIAFYNDGEDTPKVNFSNSLTMTGDSSPYTVTYEMGEQNKTVMVFTVDNDQVTSIEVTETTNTNLPVATYTVQNEETSVTFTADAILTENTKYDIVAVEPDINVTVKSGICLTVEKELCGAVCGEQDAQLEIGANATVTGITLYDANCTDTWRDFSHREVFVWLEKDDQEQDIKKWVRFVPESGYESFGPTAELPYMVEFHWNGGGNATVQGEYDQMPNGNNTKVRVANTVESLTFELHPNENERIDGIRVEQEGVAETNPDGFVDLDNDNRYNSTDNTFTLNLTDSRYNDSEATGIKFVNINFDFTGGQPGPDGPQGPSENQYCLRYSDMGSVEDADNGAVLDFTANEPLTWTLTYPQDVTNLYRVEINIYGDPGDHFEYNYGADNNSDRITVDNTNKTVSFTPESANPFEVFIYWTEQDRFNQFGCNPDEEIQLQCRVLYGHMFGTSIDAPWCSVHDEQSGWDSMKINVPKETTSFQISFTNEQDYEFEKAVFSDAQDSTLTVDTTEGIAYTWAAADFGKELNIYFKQSGEEPGPQEPQDDPEGSDIDKAEAFIRSMFLGYYPGEGDAAAQCAKLETYMATELWAEGTNGPNAGVFNGIFASRDDLEAAITVDPASYYKGDAEIIGLYDYTVAFPDESTMSGVVYVMETSTQCILMIGDEMQFLDAVNVDHAADDTLTVRSSEKETLEGVEIRLYGNGVSAVGALNVGSGDGWAAHITQEHSGLASDSSIGGLAFRLAILAKEYEGVQIEGGIKAAPWGFAEVPLFATGESADTAPVAEIYYGNDGRADRLATISQGALCGEITKVEVNTDLISGNVASITQNGDDFVINFNSNYDEIPLKVTYADSSVGYLMIHRVGLDIQQHHVSNEGKFVINHGTDNQSPYDPNGNAEAVTASFYYDTGAEKPEKHVSLFVTIKTTSGTTRKIVSPVNSDYIETTGGDKWADDFILWQGSEEAYRELLSVSAIVYDPGDDNSFGGVRVGSGAGVEWTKPSTR